MFTSVLAVVGALCYAGASGLFFKRLSSDASPAGVPLTITVTALAGSAAHAAVVSSDVLTAQGFNLGVFNTGSLITGAIALMVVLTNLARPMSALGAIVLPLAALGLLLGRFVAAEHLLANEVGLGVQIHVITSILAYSVLAIGSIQSLVLYAQERRLRQRQPGKLTRRLPSMQTQELLLVQLLVLGFFLLSLSLATGMVFVQDILAQHLVHKTVLTTVAWAVFACLLYGRWRSGWRGRTLIRWTLGGFCVLMVGYFGSKLVLEILLGRSWSAG